MLQMYNPGEEEKRYIRSLPPQRMQHYLASRLLVRTFYPDAPVVKDDFGKPFLENREIQFSWSHSGEFASAVFSTTSSTGIDIEKVSTRVMRIEDKFCNQADKHCIVRTRHAESLLIIWAAKESMYKWYGLKEVDFKKHMTVGAFDLADEGRFEAEFHKPDCYQKFIMQYLFIDGHIAVWIAEQWEDQKEETK